MKSLPIKRKRKPYFLIPCIIVALIFLIYKFNFLNINKLNVAINNADCVTEQNIINDSGLIGKNILFFESGNIDKKFLSKYSCIKNISWEKQFPKSLKVVVQGRSSFMRVARYNIPVHLPLEDLEASPSSAAASLDWSLPNIADKEFLADEGGFVFKESRGEKLPIVFLPDIPLKIFDQLDGKLFNNLVTILDKLNKDGIISQDSVEQLKFKLIDNNLLINFNQKIVLSLSKDIFRQLASLQLILQKAKIDGRTMDIIDLRFDKPIVIYSEKKK